MNNVQPKSWIEIISFYQDIISAHGWKCQPMLQLAECIAASEFAAGLFPYTSMSTLCLAHIHKPQPYQEELRITFDPVHSEFHFDYWSHPFVQLGPWKQTCDAADGFATFERIVLKYLRWFKQAVKTEQSKGTSSPSQQIG
jgi:hypothetical protein